MTTLREAVANLIKVRGRHNTEIAYQKLVEAFDADTEVCCQDFENCRSSCTPRGQWIAHVRCGCGDQIMPNDGAECGNCVTARNAMKPQPVAQVHIAEDYYPHVIWAEGINAACFDQQYLYITPPQREFIGLTDKEIEQIHYGIKRKGMGAYSTNDIYRAIEAKLKEKNSG